MSKFSQKKFNQFVLNSGIIGFFAKPIKLVSGRTSSWYVNWRNVASDVFLIDQLSDFVIDFCRFKKIEHDCLYGTPDGATKLAVLCQYKWAKKQKKFQPGRHILAMGRKTPKDHGEPKDRFFVGAPSGRVVVLEDVTTTGGSLIKTVATLKKMRIKVAAALALTSRNEKTEDNRSVAEVLKKLGVKYLAMSHALELLPMIVKQKKISRKIHQSIIDEFKQYGESGIDL